MTENSKELEPNSLAAKRVSIGTRYPLERVKLLELLQVRRGESNLSDTITAALDDFLTANGLLERAA